MEIDQDMKPSLRPLHCEMNVLSRSDGSALFTQGGTAIMASVYGPIEVKPQKLQIDRASVEAVYRPKSGLSLVCDRLREALLRQTCESAVVLTSYPRTSISFTVQEMQDSGGLLACATNALCMALVNSGVALKFLFAAVSCVVDNQGNVILDPSTKQLQDSKASLTFVFDSVDKNIVTIHTTGRFSTEKFSDCLLQCRLASEQVFAFYRSIVTKYANII